MADDGQTDEDLACRPVREHVTACRAASETSSSKTVGGPTTNGWGWPTHDDNRFDSSLALGFTLRLLVVCLPFVVRC